jgi:hypothetical protein
MKHANYKSSYFTLLTFAASDRRGGLMAYSLFVQRSMNPYVPIKGVTVELI